MSAQYTTKAKVLAYLNITALPAGLTDPMITEIIEAVSAYIENLTGRSFEVAPGTAEVRVFDGNEKGTLDIPDFTEITKLEINGVEVADTDYYLYPTDNTTFNRVDLRTTLVGNSRTPYFSYFTRGQQNIKVTAKWGWASTPAVIAMVATKMVADIIKGILGNETSNKEVISERFDDYQVTYAKVSESAEHIGVDKMLEPYILATKNAGGVIGGIVI